MYTYETFLSKQKKNNLETNINQNINQIENEIKIQKTSGSDLSSSNKWKFGMKENNESYESEIRKLHELYNAKNNELKNLKEKYKEKSKEFYQKYNKLMKNIKEYFIIKDNNANLKNLIFQLIGNK